MQVVELLPDVCNPLMTNKPVRSILVFFFTSDDDRSRCEVYGFVRMRLSWPRTQAQDSWVGGSGGVLGRGFSWPPSRRG